MDLHQLLAMKDLTKARTKPKAVKVKMPVVCMECNKKFSTTKVIPECPRCNSSDIELADSVTRKNGRV